MAGINRSIVQNNSNYSIDRDTRSNTRLYTIGILLLYAGSFKLDIFGSDSIKISAAMLPRDKCCTKITVAADLVPKVQYILPGPAKTMYLLFGHDCTDHQCAGWILCESNCFSPCPRHPVGQISPVFFSVTLRHPARLSSSNPSSQFFFYFHTNGIPSKFLCIRDSM